MNKAKELERKYEWFQAANYYERASELKLNDNDFSIFANCLEKEAFCYYRAAFQVQTNKEFEECLKLADQTCRNEITFLLNFLKDDNHIRIRKAEASIFYIQSWYETNPKNRKELLTTWWALESQILKRYEALEDLQSIGKLCNDMLEYTTYNRNWLTSNHSELKEIVEECNILIQKAIHANSQTNDD